MKKHKGFSALGIIAGFILTLSGCIIPDNAALMEMNRSGKWRQAENAGRKIIDSPGALNKDGLIETYFHVIYAETRLGKKREAVALMSRYDELFENQAPPPTLLWVPREIYKLKDELGLLTRAQKTLISAMEENEKGNYETAIELCDKALSDETAGDAQKATANLVAAACLVRLKKPSEAEKRLLAFDALKKALPEGHQALRDEAYVREGLAELK